MPKTNLQIKAKLYKGFSDQSRLAILNTIIDRPKTVSEIVKAVKLSQPNTSAHLACLLECGLVQKTKNGQEVIYQISMKEIKDIMTIADKILSNTSKELSKCVHY